MSSEIRNSAVQSSHVSGATEGALFRTQLGEGWTKLSNNIRSRFDHDPPSGTIVRYRGVMTHVECSTIGKLLGWLVQHTGALMPHEGTNVPVSIEVWTEAGSAAVFKRREYFFKERRPFTFRSKMQLDSSGNLAEYVGGGFGMYLRVHVFEGNLHFEDKGYFVDVLGIRIPIPGLLSPGRVLLKHEEIGKDEFAITIEITHPWFGLLYFQQGRFRHDLPSSN